MNKLPICLLFITTIATAQSIELEPVKDNTLYETFTGDLSNGQGSSLFIGRTGGLGGNALRRAVLAFDLSAVPALAQIDNVELSFDITMQPGIAAGFNAKLHRLSQDWGEGASVAIGAGGDGNQAESGDATWLHTFFDDQFWQQTGGDFQSEPSSTVFVDDLGRFTFTNTPELIDDVNSWLANPQSNFGWIILGSESASGNARRIASRENLTLDQRPRLLINFTLPPAQAVPATTNYSLTLLIIVFLIYFGYQNRSRRD